MLIFWSRSQLGSRGSSIVVSWLDVGGAIGEVGVWYLTVNVEGEESLQWKRDISGWMPTNILL